MRLYERCIAILIAYGIVLIFITPAYGYIDSGTGSMLIQVVIAALTAAGVFLGMARHKIRTFFKRVFGKKKEQEESNS